MKKIICWMLVLVLTMELLPLNALAAEDTFTLSDAEYSRIVRTVGMDTVWREGMSWSASMSSYQKFCWLKDFRETVVSPTRDRLTLAFGEAEDHPAADSGSGDLSLKGMDATLYAMEMKLNAHIFDLETEINAVQNADPILSDKSLSAGERAASYRRVKKAGDILADIDNALKNGPMPSVWQSQADAINGQLDLFFETVAREEAAKPLLLTSSGGASFDIIILDTSEIGIEVRTQDSVAISGAEVTIGSGSSAVTAKTDARGVALFPTGRFYMDSHNRMDTALTVKKSGYRTWQSQSIQITGGEGVHIYLEKDNGESYVQYATFRGVDIAHDTEKVYYTPLNDAQQSFRVGIHTRAGHQGVFTMTYTPADSEEPVTLTRNVTGATDGITELDLKDTWCSMLAPDQPVTLDYRESETVAPTFFRDQAITTEKAVTDRPLKEITGIPSYIPGTSFDLDIPFGLPGLESLRFSLKMPWEIFNLPVHFALTTNGDFFFSLAIASVKEITDKATDDNSWKTASSKKTAEMYSDFINGRKSLTQISKEGAQRDGAKATTLQMMKVSFMASFCLLLNGKVTRDKEAARDADPYKGEMDLFLTFALDAAISYTFPFMVGPIPCHVGFDLGVGISAGLDMPFTFTTTSGGFNFFSNWHNLTFLSEYMDIIISPRVSVAVAAGAGVKGLAGIYIRGYAGLSLNLHIRPMNKDKLTTEATLTAGVQIIAELLFFSVRATLWSKTWHFDLPRLSAGNGGAVGDEDHVQAEVTQLATVDEASEYQTVQVGDDFYAFWIADKAVGGVTRPWLNGAKIDPESGTFTPLELPYLYIGNKADKKLTDEVKAVHFDLTSTNDIRRKEGDFDMITLAVTFEVAKVPFPQRNLVSTVFDVDFYNIVFYGDGQVNQYSVSMGSFTDDIEDSVVTVGSVSIAFDEKVQKSSADHPEYWYYLMYTNVTSCYPTTVNYGTASIRLTPDANFDRFLDVQHRSGYKDFSTSAHRIDTIYQVYGLARGVGTGNNDVYVLASLKDSDDTVLIARDAMGDLGSAQSYEEDTLTGDIGGFRFIPGSDKEAGILAIFRDRDEAGRFTLQLVDHRFGADGRPRFNAPRDLGIRLSTADFDLVDLGGSRALYYLESLSTDAKQTGYSIRAIYLAEGSDGKTFSTHPFHLAVFDPADVSLSKGISYLKLYADNAGYIQGFLLEKTSNLRLGSQGSEERYTGDKKVNLKYFSFRQTMQAIVGSAIPEQTLVKPGDTVNVLFSLTNTGNIPASKITLGAYAAKAGSTAKIPLADILINCENPELSRVTPVDGDMPFSSGSEAVSRYDSVGSEQMNTFVVSEGGNTTVYATEVLMPDDTYNYRAGFAVPADFAPGQYTIYVSFKNMSTRVLLQASRYDAVSAWPRMLYDVDTQTPQSVIPTLGSSRGGKGGSLGTLTMTMLDPPPLLMGGLGGNTDDDGGLTPVTYKYDSGAPVLLAGRNGSINSRFATGAKNSRADIPLEDADLSIDARLSLEAGTEMVHMVIRNEGMAPASGIVLDAAVDDEDTLTHAFGDTVLEYKKAISLDIPLKTITKGKTGETLDLRVSGVSPETNLVNNTDDLPLNTDLLITRQPADQFVPEGASAAYSVLARGGKKPYTYQWQVSTGGQNGPFRNISGATGQSLSLSNVTRADNGRYYRVIVRDVAGRTVTSRAALLMVSHIPPTGDPATPALWLLSLCAALAGVFLLRAKRRRAVR